MDEFLVAKLLRYLSRCVENDDGELRVFFNFNFWDSSQADISKNSNELQLDAALLLKSCFCVDLDSLLDPFVH